VGAHGHLTRSSNGLSPGTKHKRSKNVFAVTSIVLTVIRLCSDLLQLTVQSLSLSVKSVSPGTLYPWPLNPFALFIRTYASRDVRRLNACMLTYDH